MIVGIQDTARALLEAGDRLQVARAAWDTRGPGLPWYRLCDELREAEVQYLQALKDLRADLERFR